MYGAWVCVLVRQGGVCEVVKDWAGGRRCWLRGVSVKSVLRSGDAGGVCYVGFWGNAGDRGDVGALGGRGVLGCLGCLRTCVSCAGDE